MPAAPSLAGNTSEIVFATRPCCRSDLILAHSAFVITGVSSRRSRHCCGVESSRFPSRPIVVIIEVMISSRIASSGGLVTCAKSCLK